MPSPARLRHLRKLKVLIRSASHLPRVDDRLCDPYVVCLVSPSATPAFQTQVCYQTLDPNWDEEYEIHYEPGADLVFQVLDKDDTYGSERHDIGDDFLGEICLASEEFFPNGFESDVMLDGVPDGKAAFLRLRIIVDEDEEDFSPAQLQQQIQQQMQQLHLQQPQQPQHETSLDDVELVKQLESPGFRPQSSKAEQRGGSSGSNAKPAVKARAPEPGTVRRLSVTLKGANGLPSPSGGRCSPYCVCEVQGNQRFQTRSAVVNESRDPVWNKSFDFDYAAVEPIVFSIFNKEVWPKKDSLLGTAALDANDVVPDGLDGVLAIEPAEDHLPGAVLHLQVVCHGERRAVSRREHPHQRFLTQDGGARARLEAASAKTAPHPADMAPQRLRVLIQSFRGLHGLELSVRRCFSCICAIAGRRHADLQTGGAFEAGYQTVWNLEGHIEDYIPGEDLEFHVAAEEGLEGSAFLRCQQFYPFGFNSELSMSNDGHGIIGLLRVKVTVDKEPPKKPLMATGSRTLGLQGSNGARLSQQQGDVWLRSHRPWGAVEASLAAAAGADRHHLSTESSSVIRRDNHLRPAPASPTRRAASPVRSAVPVASSKVLPTSPVATTIAMPVISPRPVVTGATAMVTTTYHPPIYSQPAMPYLPATYLPSTTYVTSAPSPSFGLAVPAAPAAHCASPAPAPVPEPLAMPYQQLQARGPGASAAGHLMQWGDGGVDQGRASAGALSLLAEAQASWRAGQCHAAF
ncbi:unnamed protein product [Effrenium voratum]|nr:unnamed protein product [Effrenium voratum]